MRARSLALTLLLSLVVPLAVGGEGASAAGYGRMFPTLAPFTTPTDEQIADLVQRMRDRGQTATDNRSIPAGYTYLGQLVDHDVTRDTQPSPTAPVDVLALVNARTGNLDLDQVYGGGPARAPELYEADGAHLRVGVSNGIPDVPRRADGTAVVADGRDDENLLLVQLHAAVLRFHNRLVDEGRTFDEAERLTRFHYQWLVLHDYLPRIVGRSAVDRVLGGATTRYEPGDPRDPVLPVEFSVAAFRFGHSQVRGAYAVNATTTAPVFSADPAVADLRGGRVPPPGTGVDWQRFFAVDGATVTPQPSKRIDTRISRPLFELPIGAGSPANVNMLAFRSLVRGRFYGLPSGQDVARALGQRPLRAGHGPGFASATPLGYAVLLDAERRQRGVRLGPLGARIVADVLVTNLMRDPGSYLNAEPAFIPSVPHEGEFTTGDFLRFAGVV